MAEIASRAGVSRATVSIILSSPNPTDTRFKPETVIRVQQIAKEMGYQMNLMALSLRNPHPSFFGLILRGTTEAEAISWHHQALEGQLQAGVIEAARRARLFPVLATQLSPEPGETLDRVLGVIDGGVFGAILRTPDAVLIEPIKTRIADGLPAVIIFPDEAGTLPTNCIDMDNTEAGRVAGALLRDVGRSCWLIIRDQMSRSALQRRCEGAMEIARACGATVEMVEVPFTRFQPAIVDRLAPALKQIRPDGIYAASWVSGVGTMLACSEVGLHIPDEACLVGCDASLWRPEGFSPITSVDVSWYRAGEVAVQKMIELCDRDESVFESILLPPVIRKGGTCPGGHVDPPKVI